jgi:hypothetical protein
MEYILDSEILLIIKTFAIVFIGILVSAIAALMITDKIYRSKD